MSCSLKNNRIGYQFLACVGRKFVVSYSRKKGVTATFSARKQLYRIHRYNISFVTRQSRYILFTDDEFI